MEYTKRLQGGGANEAGPHLRYIPPTEHDPRKVKRLSDAIVLDRHPRLAALSGFILVNVLWVQEHAVRAALIAGLVNETLLSDPAAAGEVHDVREKFGLGGIAQKSQVKVGGQQAHVPQDFGLIRPVPLSTMTSDDVRDGPLLLPPVVLTNIKLIEHTLDLMNLPQIVA